MGTLSHIQNRVIPGVVRTPARCPNPIHFGHPPEQASAPWGRMMNVPHDIDLGVRVGLIGDVHGNNVFLEEAVVALAGAGVDSLVQLGDFGHVWAGSDRELRVLQKLDTLLELVGRDLWIVPGNHEGYDAINALPPDADGVRCLGEHRRVRILPRAGTATAAGRRVGWLSGAASVDRDLRGPGTWWAAELPTDDEAAPLYDASRPLEVVFAHDALDSAALRQRIAPMRPLWPPASLAYAEEARVQFHNRVLYALSDGGLVVSGHYHLHLDTTERFERPDGTPISGRSVVLDMEWRPHSVAILDVATQDFEYLAVSIAQRRERVRAFVTALRQRRDLIGRLTRDLGIPQRDVHKMQSGSVAVPVHVVRALDEWSRVT